MADQTIWKLDLQAGNSDAILKSFENSLNVAKDRINQVVAAGENFSKLDNFQQKAAEAAKKLEVAQAQAALALKKAQDAAQGGKVSAEQLALMQAKAGLAAEQVTNKETALGVAMSKVQLEADRLQTAMVEEANKCESLGKIFTFLKDTAESAASGISTGFKVVQETIGVVSEKVSNFASNMRENMESARSEIVETEAVSNEASGGMFSKFQEAGGGLLEFASKAGFAFMGVQIAIQTVQGAINSVLGPAEAYQDILKQTNDVVKSTGGAAGMSAQAITDLATSLGKTSFFSRDAVQSGENLLLTFTGIGREVFPQATKTMLDMSKAMGQDVKSSAIQLGKALNDPATGLTALTRVGVTFTAQQKAMIKQMVAVGDTAGAQKIMLAELQREFGGSADATKTFAGQQEILQHRFNDFKEQIGSAILPILSSLTQWLSDRVMPVLDGLASFLQNVAVPALMTFGGYIQKNIVPVLQAWGHTIQVWALDKLHDLQKFIDANIMPELSEFWAFIQTKIVPILQSWGHNIQIWVLNKLADVKSFIDKNVMPALAGFWAFIQTHIVPVLQSWGHNIQVYVIDKFNDLKAFIDKNVMPKLSEFWAFIQTHILPILFSWGDNIQKWVIDKFNDLKAFIDKNVMPKLNEFWSFIQTYILPVLISWGGNIKTWVIDKLADLKTFIETKIMPKLIELWGWIQNNIVQAFSDWGGKVKGVQDNLASFKDFIEKQVIPALLKMWGWVNTYIVPVFQSLGKILTDDVIAPFKGIWDTIQNQLLPALNRLWAIVAQPLTFIFMFLAWLVGNHVNASFTGLKEVLDLVGIAIKGALDGINRMIAGLSMIINWVITAYNWFSDLNTMIGKVAANIITAPLNEINSLINGGGGSPPKPSKTRSFASGVENFGGGLAFVHAKEMLVNLPKGMSVWNPAKTAAFMQGLKIPTPNFAQPASSSSSSSGGNDQVVGLLAAILGALQKQSKGGNVTMNANVAAGSMSAQRINQLIQSLGGHEAEMMQRGGG